MKWLLGLVLVLLAVGTSASVEAQIGEVVTQHPSWDETKSPAVIDAERRVKRNRIALGVSAVPIELGAIMAKADALGSISQTGTMTSHAAADDTAPSSSEPSARVKKVRRAFPEGNHNSPNGKTPQPALELELDSEGVRASPPSAALSSPGVDIRGARAGLTVSCVLVAGGSAAIAASFIASGNSDDLGSAIGKAAIGTVLGSMAIIGGIVGIAMTSRTIHDAKAGHGRVGTPSTGHPKRRVRWDPAVSGVRF